MEKMLCGRITRFTEYRNHRFPFLASLTGWPLYHTWSIMEPRTISFSNFSKTCNCEAEAKEVNNGQFQILLERCLESKLCVSPLSRTFFW